MRQMFFYSEKGREIKVYVFGDNMLSEGLIGESKGKSILSSKVIQTLQSSVLVIGGVHGDESIGVDLAEALLSELDLKSVLELNKIIVVIPIANPDGYIAHSRVNAHGVDINRNFPTKDFGKGYFKRNCYPGEEAISESETRAILTVAEEYKPDLIITFHAELGCINYDGPAEEIAQVIARHNGFQVRKELGYPTHGSLGTYFGRERNIPVITLELLPGEDQWERHGKSILEAIGVEINTRS